MKQRYFVDANVLVRFLLGDDPAQSTAAADAFARAETGEFILEISAVALAETAWVLHSVYKVPRAAMAEKLTALLHNPGVRAADSEMTEDALRLLRTTNADIADCMLAAEARRSSAAVLSFDRDFQRFPGLEWKTPAHL